MARLIHPALKAIITTLLLGVLSSLIAAYLFQFFPFQRPADYLIRITVLSPTKVPVDDARVWSNLGGELKGVKGGYELSLSTEQFSYQNLEVFAEVPEEGWIGHATVHLKRKYTVEVSVPLAEGGEPDVRGSVINNRGLGVPGAIVTIIGYGSKQVISDAMGGFSLPSHAGAGAIVQVHAEKSPDLRGDVQARVGGGPVSVKLLPVATVVSDPQKNRADPPNIGVPPDRPKKGISYVQQQIQSDNPKYAHELRITLTTGDEIDRASFELYFDRPYEAHDAIFQDGSYPFGNVYRVSNESYHLNLDSIFEPDNPLVVRIYSNEPLRCTGMSRFH